MVERGREKMLLAFLIVLLQTGGGVRGQALTQESLNHIATFLKVTWEVVSNTEEAGLSKVEVTLDNQGPDHFRNGTWALHFDCLRMLEPGRLVASGAAELEGQGMRLTHVQGSHFALSPSTGFIDLQRGHSRKVKFTAKGAIVAKSDFLPNWFITAPGLKPQTLESTKPASLTFVALFKDAGQFKRSRDDPFYPWSAQERYAMHAEQSGPTAGDGQPRLVPRPVFLEREGVESVTISSTWKVFPMPGKGLEPEAEYIRRLLNLTLVTEDPVANVILLDIDDLDLGVGGVRGQSQEAYLVEVDISNNRVEVKGQGRAGVFWGLQTLLSLKESSGRVAKYLVKDAPTFPRRGLRIDLVRNFLRKEEVTSLLDAMAAYKLNRLSLRLSGNEAWRLQVPGLPELTELGAKRCYDVTGQRCLTPQLGSGSDDSTSGSGFYSTQDYRDILTHASSRHIEIVPEIDFPVNARAAVKSMEERYRKLMEQGLTANASEFRLTETGDNSNYTSDDLFTDSAANPCLESTYTFIGRVLDTLVQLHAGTQALRHVRGGGGITPTGVWEKSTACKNLIANDVIARSSLMRYFHRRVSEMTSRRNLTYGVNEDVVMSDVRTPVAPSDLANSEVTSCNNSPAQRLGVAYRLANAGHKVTLCWATHLSLDHVPEPDPEVRGQYKATRYVSTRTAFSFVPLNVYSSDSPGQVTPPSQTCQDTDSCPPLTAPENVLGLEATLDTHVTTTSSQRAAMLFPRLLGVAERAWHQAEWQSEGAGPSRDSKLAADWSSFVKAVGEHELPRLQSMGVAFLVPPPGGRAENSTLMTSSAYPGLLVEFSQDGGQSWQSPTGHNVLPPSQAVLLRASQSTGGSVSRIITMNQAPPPLPIVQSMVDYIASNVRLTFKVVSNMEFTTSGFLAELALENRGQLPVGYAGWEVYFSSIYMVEPDYLPDPLGYVLPGAWLRFFHIQGSLFKMAPAYGFPPLNPGERRPIRLKIQNWMAQRTDVMPRWYVTGPGMGAKVIPPTGDESLSWVADFTTPQQWKRYDTPTFKDLYDPWTPDTRYVLSSDVEDHGKALAAILPTPVKVTKTSDDTVSMATEGWTLVADDAMHSVAVYFKELLSRLGLSSVSIVTSRPDNRYVAFVVGDPEVIINGTKVTSEEAYSLVINPQSRSVEVKATGKSGAFYAVQSLRQLLMTSAGSLPGISVKDAPRYEFRGMHLDVGRNFHTKQDVLRLLDVMALYKLNKLHFHLTEDEGWRLEIPGLPELTQVGSKRCHDLREDRCLHPELGSGPDADNSGTGHYTVAEYREILAFAAQRHIEVIPEVDSPGHARAAIKAMEARRRRLLAVGDYENAEKYVLSEDGDPSRYSSVQMFSDNAINPCLPGTYRFIAHVVDELIKMHQDVNPLKIYHFGGDEVAKGAWINSTACQALLRNGTSLKEHFSQQVSALTSARGLDLGGWEDGLMETPTTPFSRELLSNGRVYGNAWDNVWEWGASDRAHRLANAGYKVVMSQVTHTYFDHPYEPDPEERGFYWGPRYTNTRKAFGFMPDQLYWNVETARSGAPQTVADVCGKDGSQCEKLAKPENIAGLQGQLWSETVRTSQELDYMIYPRLLALAERAWHKASWEFEPNESRREAARTRDWESFANTLGYAHFRLLESLNVSYRLPPPGARETDGRVLVNSPFPGLVIEYSQDGGNSWTPAPRDGITVLGGENFILATRSHDGKRRSRTTSVMVRRITSSAAMTSVDLVTLTLLVLSAIVTMQ